MRVVTERWGAPSSINQREITIDDNSVLTSVYSDGYVVLTTAKERNADDVYEDATWDFPVVSCNLDAPLRNLNLQLTPGSRLFLTINAGTGGINCLLLFDQPTEL